MLNLLLFFLPIAYVTACEPCPTGGIWSAWTTNEQCKTTCGACTYLNYTRTCLSSQMKNCPCSGITKTIKPCNTQACNYPRANGPTPPCCFGLTPSIINNWYYCVNSSEPNVPTPTCCPAGGIWGEWTDWVRTTGKVEWTRSRTCVSNGYNCACTGDHEQIKNDCPCAPMKSLRDSFNPCASLTTKKLYYDREPVYFPSTCSTRIALESTNFRAKFYSAGPVRPYCTTGYIDHTGQCKLEEFETGGMNTNGAYWYFTFSCNTTSGEWNRNLIKNNTGTTVQLIGVTHIGQFYEP